MFTFKRLAKFISPLALAAGLTTTASAQDRYIGELMLVGYTFCPRFTTEAAGQLLAISANSALFSLYGTTFGGDGRTTFALPDLRGRTVIGNGAGPGLTTRLLGQRSGAERVTLNITEMPNHNHQLAVNNEGGDKRRPRNDFLSYSTLTEGLPPDQVEKMYATAPTPGAYLDASSITSVGGNLSHENMPPWLAMRYCVVLQGLYPSRS